MSEKQRDKLLINTSTRLKGEREREGEREGGRQRAREGGEREK